MCNLGPCGASVSFLVTISTSIRCPFGQHVPHRSSFDWLRRLGGLETCVTPHRWDQFLVFRHVSISTSWCFCVLPGHHQESIWWRLDNSWLFDHYFIGSNDGDSETRVSPHRREQFWGFGFFLVLGCWRFSVLSGYYLDSIFYPLAQPVGLSSVILSIPTVGGRRHI